ncbi:hypothetical protein [Aetokthonos hydrillicola]|jgi:hypothetical protein|uniref:hypothetical protein n=1 Tax=Aetokthonos hydrillicola TaxID=1550245 RepID=UPI002877CC37|nr:hypothetical protein [Aetokthonos hydrillicola]
MTQTVAITEAITTLSDAENRFGLVRVESEQFFTEWNEGLLSEITEAEKASVDVLRRRYLYHRAAGDLLEQRFANSQTSWSGHLRLRQE